MVGTTFMTMLCLAGVAFCIRFLVALGKERKARSTLLAAQYWLKPRGNPAIAEHNNPVDRAALERIGRGPFSETSGALGNTNRSEKGYF